MSADIDAVATSRREPTSVSHGARYAGTAMACVALVLMLLQAMLYVASGWGVEDFLGWADPGPANAMLRVWDRIGVGGVAWAYLTLDSLVFVPVYTAFFAALALHLSDGLAPVEQAVRPARVLSGVLAAPLIALFVVDLVENGLGMARLHEWGWLAALATTIVAIGFLGRIGALKHLLARLGAWALVGAVALALVLLAVGWLQGNTCKLDGAVRSAGWIWPFGCAAHRAKQALTLLLILVMLLAVGAWLFGLGSAAHDIALREARARLRAAIGDMLLRSRYVLLALLALAGLTVAMDQGRDVVYAVAAAPYRDIANWRSWAGAFAVFAASASAVWLLVFACWLWTRSVCQLQAVHDTAAVAAAAGASPGLRPEDLFARDWARVLAMMP
ncbi:MAG TPA: hypothetical protein VKI18_05940, partial [Albitalea sp.]|nr:hypothetical protein [Albitalea sp.]